MIQLSHVGKQFDGKRNVTALHDVSLTVGRGELVSIIGPSGSGKSTLLNLVGGLDHPTSGRVIVDGRPKRGSRTRLTLNKLQYNVPMKDEDFTLQAIRRQ